MLTKHQGGMVMEKEKVNYTSMFWLFMFGSVAGFLIEGIWCVIRSVRWENHSATLWEPFCIIYGFGAVLVYLLALFVKKRSLLLQFVIYTLAGGSVEYFGSLFQEVFFGSVSWDYSDHFFNIDGRVSLKMALIWGVLGIALSYLVLPYARHLLEMMRGRFWHMLCLGLSLFMVVNLMITSLAVSRWQSREESTHPLIWWIDETYDDETMLEHFPNMHWMQKASP